MSTIEPAHDYPEITWETFEGHLLLADHFIPIHRREGDKVEGPRSGARAYLGISDVRPDLGRVEDEVGMPILHKEDFKVLWWLFMESGVATSLEVRAAFEVMVAYGPPQGFLARLQPRLQVEVYPAGWAADFLKAEAEGLDARIAHIKQYRPLFKHDPGRFDWNCGPIFAPGPQRRPRRMARIAGRSPGRRLRRRDEGRPPTARSD